MLDLETGKFSWGEGFELYPGMSLEEFRKSKVFQCELKNPEDKNDMSKRSFCLREQTIDGFQMVVAVDISMFGYVEEIILSKPEYYNWPNWPKELTEKEYALEILDYNRAFVRKQIEEGMVGKDIKVRSLQSFADEWGGIGTACDFRDIPRVEAKIRYGNFGRGIRVLNHKK